MGPTPFTADGHVQLVTISFVKANGHVSAIATDSQAYIRSTYMYMYVSTYMCKGFIYPIHAYITFPRTWMKDY